MKPGSQTQKGGVHSQFFKELKDQNKKVGQILDDATQFQRDFYQETKEYGERMEAHKQQFVQEIQTRFNDFSNKYLQANKVLENNLLSFEQQINKKDAIKRNSLLKMKLGDFFLVPPDVVLPEWWEPFYQAQVLKLEKILEEMALKLFKARITDEVKQVRSRISSQSKDIITDISKHYQNSEIPLQKVIQFEKLVCELQQYDALVPQLCADLANRASEFLQNLLAQALSFNKQCDQELEQLKKKQLESDDAFRYEFNNIQLMDPNKIRTHRYDIVLRNKDLCSFLPGQWINERIPFFFIEFFRERNKYQGLQDISEILVMKFDFFESLVPPGGVLDWNNLIYSSVKQQTAIYKGVGNTIFDKFGRILIGCVLSANNYILIEIKNRPDKEILIYDADFAQFSIFHEKIIRCVRAYIIEELRDKTDWSEGQCIENARLYIGRSVNCPQIQFPYDNGIYFIKNLHLCSDGKYVSPASYRAEALTSYRLQLFSSCLRVGINNDRSVAFDILL